MLGNVQEWTSTRWGTTATCEFPYPYRPHDGREDAVPAPGADRTRRVHRGGSYRDTPEQLRCAARGSSSPESRVRWRGFRVVREI